MAASCGQSAELRQPGAQSSPRQISPKTQSQEPWHGEPPEEDAFPLELEAAAPADAAAEEAAAEVTEEAEAEALLAAAVRLPAVVPLMLAEEPEVPDEELWAAAPASTTSTPPSGETVDD
jgi:hypothetical protein